MNSSKHGAFLYCFARFSEPIHPNVVRYDRIFRQSASSEIPNHLADDASVTTHKESGSVRVNLSDNGSSMISLKLPLENRQISALGREHLIPLPARRSRIQAIFSSSAAGVVVRRLPRKHKQLRGAGKDDRTKIF